MELFSISLSYRTAPVALREQLAGLRWPADGAVPFEWAVLSTCNRWELYAAADTVDFEQLIALAEVMTGVRPDEFAVHLVRYLGEEVGLHLCRVAAGLDSLILGEPQILGQVARAGATAKQNGTLGPVLGALFETAIRVGKRARTETGISRNPASIGTVAARQAQHVVSNLAAAQVLVIGAGEMAELTVEALRSRGARKITILNRTLERSRTLAERWGADALTYADLVDALSQADAVIASTSAPHFVVDQAQARAALAHRPQRPLVFIDIAVPRDIDPKVADLPNVFCYNIDDLKARFSTGISERQQALPRVEAIVAEELQAYATQQRIHQVKPLIVDLRAKADAIRLAEVSKALRQFVHLNSEDRERIEALTVSLMNKLLHAPTQRLRAEAGRGGTSADYESVVRQLFALQ
jgi:glutamyl-tRNA reductase